jgi:hypothetical protein
MPVPILRDREGRTTVLRRGLPKGTSLEDALPLWLVREGFPQPVREHQAFAFLRRRWRFDLAWPDRMIALEIDGGVYTLGRHTRGAGFEGDCRKMNAAAAAGWTVFHVTPQMVEKEWPEILHLLRAAFTTKPKCDG